MAAIDALIQVVPRFGSVLDGVGDYASQLAAAMDSSHGLRSAFVASDALEQRTSEGLGRALAARATDGAATVLLHYVNYGYESRGCPRWLVDGLSSWKARTPGARLVTMFHELYAFGPPWRSSFWLSPLQRRLARVLAALSDACVTNRHASARWLMGTGAAAGVMPVFSTLGEGPAKVPWRERLPRMVVAGRSGEPGRAYDRHRGALAQACRMLGIREIVDIGHRTTPPPAAIGEAQVRAMGHVEVPRASAILADARAGFVDYPSDFLAKSTVFAAYAAHALVPVVSWRRGPEEAGLAHGANYWVPHASDPPRDFERIAQSASAWYGDHTLAEQAAHFAALVRAEGAR